MEDKMLAKTMEMQMLIMDANRKMYEANSSVNSSWRQILIQQASEKMKKAHAIYEELCQLGTQSDPDDWWKSGGKPPEL